MAEEEEEKNFGEEEEDGWRDGSAKSCGRPGAIR